MRIVFPRASSRRLFASLALLAGCGGGGNDAVVAFHAQQDAFPGVAADTGFQPASSPVQLRFEASAMGGVTVDARATGGGTSGAPTLVGNAGSGRVALDLAVSVHPSIRIDIPGVLGHAAVHYEGPLNGLDDLALQATGSATFDPFLVGGTAVAHGTVPDTALPPIPLMPATGVPGTLTLHITGDADATFAGACAAITPDATAQYLGDVTTTATLHVVATVTLEVPGFSRTLTLPSIPVPLPPTHHAVDLGTHPVAALDPTAAAAAGGSMAMQSACGAVDPDAGAGPSPDASASEHDAAVTPDVPAVDAGPPPECAFARDCAAHQACAAGRCVLDRASSWDLELISADVPEHKPDGSSWDPFGGLPDPMVVVVLPFAQWTSPTITNSLHPVWNATALQAISAGSLLDSALAFDVMDDDSLSHNDEIGRCQTRVAPTAFDGSPQTVNDPSCPGVTVRYRVLPH